MGNTPKQQPYPQAHYTTAESRRGTLVLYTNTGHSVCPHNHGYTSKKWSLFKKKKKKKSNGL